MITPEEFAALKVGDVVRLNRPRSALLVLVEWVEEEPGSWAHWELCGVGPNPYVGRAVLLERNRKYFAMANENQGRK